MLTYDDMSGFPNNKAMCSAHALEHVVDLDPAKLGMEVDVHTTDEEIYVQLHKLGYQIWDNHNDTTGHEEITNWQQRADLVALAKAREAAGSYLFSLEEVDAQKGMDTQHPKARLRFELNTAPCTTPRPQAAPFTHTHHARSHEPWP
jgi:hypothetical protein